MVLSSKFHKVFAHRHVLLPVIHVESAAQTLRNVQIARTAGADGVFLINHCMSWRGLLQIQHESVIAFPNWWVGVNCLDLKPAEAFTHLSSEIPGLWVDNAMVHETQPAQSDAERILRSQQQSGWPGLYFGGVAFKYQRQVNDLANACNIAKQFMDVVTTSGPGTGSAASPEKIRAMKQALGQFPLAIASGITPENVADYLDAADCFLVATGISSSFYEFDPARVAALVGRIRAFNTN